MSIVRVGLGETENFAQGYEAIFGKKPAKPEPAKAPAEEESSKAEPKPDDPAK